MPVRCLWIHQGGLRPPGPDGARNWIGSHLRRAQALQAAAQTLVVGDRDPGFAGHRRVAVRARGAGGGCGRIARGVNRRAVRMAAPPVAIAMRRNRCPSKPDQRHR